MDYIVIESLNLGRAMYKREILTGQHATAEAVKANDALHVARLGTYCDSSMERSIHAVFS